MTIPELEALEALTREYAAFQSRKSGLGTALGGLLAILLVLAALSPDLMGANLLKRPLLDYILFVPFLWLILKWLGGLLLYRGLGTVKAMPDEHYERRRWFWILSLALFLMAYLVAGLYGFMNGFLIQKPMCAPLGPPASWVLLLPLLYVLPMPWVIRGIEEARVYAVLVAQCMIWLVPLFLFAFGPRNPPNQAWTLVGHLSMTAFLVLILLIQIWGALAMIRGWKEHRRYLALLRSLPRQT
jgi:hypothetical protein